MAGKHEGWWKCFPLTIYSPASVYYSSSEFPKLKFHFSNTTHWMFIFYELNVCVFSISLCWSPPFQCDGIWGGNFGRYLFRLPEVMRVEPHDRTSAFIRRGGDTRIFSLCTRERYMSTYWDGCYLQARKRAFTKNQTIRHLDLGLLSLQNCENINVLCKPPSMWHFVIATQTDEGSNPVSEALRYSPYVTPMGSWGKKHIGTEISGKGLCCL